MAIEQSSRTYGDPPIQTTTKVDTDTGKSEIYIFIDGEEKLAATGRPNGTWSLKPRFRRKFNSVTGDTLSDSEFEDYFAENFQRRADRDRAKIINKNSSDAVKKQLSDEGLAFVKSPEETEGVPDETADQSKTSNTSNIEVRGNQEGAITGGALYYPVSLADDQAALKIEILEYEPGGLGEGLYGGRSAEPVGSPISTIFLPIPRGASDNNTAGWSSGDMTALDAAVADLTLKGMKGDVEGVGERAKAIVNDIGKNSEDTKNLVATMLVQGATGIGKAALQRQEGAIINPNTELLFNNPNLRDFNFSYELAPRDDGEAKTVVNIIRALKTSMAPRRTKSTLFLKSPNLFRLSYVLGRGGGVNPYLNKFKLCALKGLTTNYAPNDTFMSFSDDIPVRYDITMQFQEIIPIYQDEYQGTGVGY